MMVTDPYTLVENRMFAKLKPDIAKRKKRYKGILIAAIIMIAVGFVVFGAGTPIIMMNTDFRAGTFFLPWTAPVGMALFIGGAIVCSLIFMRYGYAVAWLRLIAEIEQAEQIDAADLLNAPTMPSRKYKFVQKLIETNNLPGYKLYDDGVVSRERLRYNGDKTTVKRPDYVQTASGAAPTSVCPSCGSNMAAGTNFCPMCGKENKSV